MWSLDRTTDTKAKSKYTEYTHEIWKNIENINISQSNFNTIFIFLHIAISIFYHHINILLVHHHVHNTIWFTECHFESYNF